MIRQPMATSILGALAAVLLLGATSGALCGEYQGRYCGGTGDVEYLRLIDRSFAFFHPSPGQPNISMLYNADWDCLVEGPMWGGWWVQNSYGPTYCALPFLQEPWLTFLQHSHDLWFRHQGDGRTEGWHGLVSPEGNLCDCATPGGCVPVQGDSRWDIHDWGFEFTAAGVVMQAELLLISRDAAAIRRYLPHLERACDFIETRRDPDNGLFLVGPAANLLAPSYGGVRQADGSFGKGYLAGLSVTYLAALDRMVELCKLAGDRDKTAVYEQRREMTQRSLPQLLTADGYFVKFVEPDGTKHGVLGQERYGYFEAVVNHDAIAFRAVDAKTAERIYAQIASLPGLRPNDFIITNWPSLDDTYANWGSRELSGLWEFGRWVNGGAWSTCEARAILAYYRLGKYEDVRRSARRSMALAEDYQMDAPLADFGASVWFKDNPTNLCYDALGIPAATIRGLFEYIYGADTLTLHPHVPATIEEYWQREPIRWGEKRITLRVRNAGPRMESAHVNGRRLRTTADCVVLSYGELPREARVSIVMEGGWPEAHGSGRGAASHDDGEKRDAVEYKAAGLPADMQRAFTVLKSMQERVASEGDLAYERAYVDEALAAFAAYRERAARDAAGVYPTFTAEKRIAILDMHRAAALNLARGFEALMQRYAENGDSPRRQVAGWYAEAQGAVAD
ncbi:MAG: hypothetical protein JSV65_08360 [Armatimonadota bacterium]|nr:MAG: hypothetical protein JSV65_08360 [Armatimonadota bacterium]